LEGDLAGDALEVL